ncbi:hypothetical protein OWR28_21750 [Chryseobacterium sp. 1B4]
MNPNKLSNYMARVCDGQKAVVTAIKPLEFNSIADALKNGAHINQLVKIKNVQFEEPELTKTLLTNLLQVTVILRIKKLEDWIFVSATMQLLRNLLSLLNMKKVVISFFF